MPYHQFIFEIGKAVQKASPILNDSEFEAVMNQLQWKMPFGIHAYHCSQPVYAGNNPVLRQANISDTPIDVLLGGRSLQDIRLKDKRRQITMPVQYKAKNYVLADTEDGYGRLYYVDGESSCLITHMTAVPISLAEAREYIKAHHRHCGPPKFHKFSVCLKVEGEEEPVGVAIASTPSSRYQMNGKTLEIKHCCGDSRYADVCSSLLGRVIRIGREMGYTRYITYTLENESGSSLRAAGFQKDGIVQTSTKGWDTPSRPRDVSEYPDGKKIRWQKTVS